MIDRYTKVVLTIIAVSLTCVALQLSVQPAVGVTSVIAGVTHQTAKCLAAYSTYTGGDKQSCLGTP